MQGRARAVAYSDPHKHRPPGVVTCTERPLSHPPGYRTVDGDRGQGTGHGTGQGTGQGLALRDNLIQRDFEGGVFQPRTFSSSAQCHIHHRAIPLNYIIELYL